MNLQSPQREHIYDRRLPYPFSSSLGVFLVHDFSVNERIHQMMSGRLRRAVGGCFL